MTRKSERVDFQRVQVHLVSEVSHLKDVPAKQWQILKTMELTKREEPKLSEVDLILDALMGYGLSGEVRGKAVEWILRANKSSMPILSLDVPSGLDATLGKSSGQCMRAAATLALGLPKTGLLAPTAKPHIGELYLADIGIPPRLYRRAGIQIGPIFSESTILKIS